MPESDEQRVGFLKKMIYGMMMVTLGMMALLAAVMGGCIGRITGGG